MPRSHPLAVVLVLLASAGILPVPALFGEPYAIPEGAIPEGAIPEGAIPEGAIPEGAIPEGAIPQSVIPQSAKWEGAARGAPPRTRPVAGRYHFVRHAARARRIHFVHRVHNRGKETIEDVKVSVGLPRTDRRQQVHQLHYPAPPATIERDDWGQRTATFHLLPIPPGGEREIRVTADVTLNDLEWILSDDDIGSVSDIPSRVRQKYLRNGKAFQLDDPSLRAAAAQLQTSDGGFLEQIRKIHDFVADSLEYERDERWDTADVVLKRGRGSCSEYAFLMIALCRLNGIPARYAGGTCLPAAMEPEIYGLDLVRRPSLLCPSDLPAENLDRVFHRWVEVYLPRAGWFPVDPTRNDFAASEGDSYRYFGRLPWFYLVMHQGDGTESGGPGLGNDYRSRTTWKGQLGVAADTVRVVRFSIWDPAPEHRRDLAALDEEPGVGD